MLGKRLAELRKARKLTQADLSKMLGIHRGTYANYEAGNREPDNETLQKLADFFEVSTDWLLGRTNVYQITPSKENSLLYDIRPQDKRIIHEKSVSRAFLELPEDVTEEEKEFLRAQLDLQLEIFRKFKEKKRDK